VKIVKILFIERSNLFDALANDEQITITAHQLPIVGNSITVATILTHNWWNLSRLKREVKMQLIV
jgi:hypothetical protein